MTDDELIERVVADAWRGDFDKHFREDDAVYATGKVLSVLMPGDRFNKLVMVPAWPSNVMVRAFFATGADSDADQPVWRTGSGQGDLAEVPLWQDAAEAMNFWKRYRAMLAAAKEAG
jgi:hypothetical protein